MQVLISAKNLALHVKKKNVNVIDLHLSQPGLNNVECIGWFVERISMFIPGDLLASKSITDL